MIYSNDQQPSEFSSPLRSITLHHIRWEFLVLIPYNTEAIRRMRISAINIHLKAQTTVLVIIWATIDITKCFLKNLIRTF